MSFFQLVRLFLSFGTLSALGEEAVGFARKPTASVGREKVTTSD
jgi:hypothetical protein